MPSTGYCGIQPRFTSTIQPSPESKRGPRGPSLTPLLKKFLEKKLDYEDPDTHKIIHGKVKHAVLWRLLLNATQGENEAIKEILNRIDGKLSEVQIDQSKHFCITYGYRSAPDSTLRSQEQPAEPV